MQETNTNSSTGALVRINRELEEKVARDRAQQLHLPYVDVGAFPINPDILHIIPQNEAIAAGVMPFYKKGKLLRIAVNDPQAPHVQAVLHEVAVRGFTTEVHFASQAGIAEAQHLYASDQYKLSVEIKNVIKKDEIKYEKELENLAHLKDKIEQLPAEESLNMLHVSAIKAGASDIHYEPDETGCVIRFRIDGILHTVFTIGRDAYGHLSNQLKYKAGMKLNITEVPQDGRYRFFVNERAIDVRVSRLPLEYGESFVCRILDSGKHFDSFDKLGFGGQSLEILEKAGHLSQGMILVTGPTGSGKTTTLYVLLHSFNRPDVKVVTLEDPIEYHLKGIVQSQIDEKRGYTFGDGLRSILRHDPDIVMIGEIRDLETGQVAVQAALTGHVMLSTLHTNSAIETIVRLITIGVSPLMVAPALAVVVSQRLVRRLCSCNTKRAITEQEKTLFAKYVPSAILPGELGAPHGCGECNMTGFRGQLVIAEALHFDDELRQAVLQQKSSIEIFALARKKGFTTILEDGLTKVLAGFTTLGEVQRATNT